MADEAVTTPAPTEAPASPAPTATPAEATPAPTSAPEPTPTVAPAPSPTAAPEAAKSTVLGADVKEPEAKPEEKTPEPEKKESEEKKEEGGQSDETAPLPTYDPFVLPEGVNLDEAEIGKFTELLGGFEKTTKADHAEVGKFGQQLVDYHIAEVRNTVERLNKAYADHWEKQKNDWLTQFEQDPEIGGNRKDTTVNDAHGFIKTHGGTPEQQAEFRNLMETTGLGNHPVMIRLLANAGMKMKEGKPLPATSPVGGQRSKVSTRYGNA